MKNEKLKRVTVRIRAPRCSFNKCTIDPDGFVQFHDDREEDWTGWYHVPPRTMAMIVRAWNRRALKDKS